MDWDLGITGVGVLLAMSLVFGLFTEVVLRRDTTRWVWLMATGVFFLVGVLVSEVLFGWATEEELQPNYDGLSFDETLLALVLAIVVVLVVRHLIRRHRDVGSHPTAPTSQAT